MTRLPFWTRVSMGHHRRTTGHTLTVKRVSVPMFDLNAKGYLVTCSGCGRTWAA